jgi:protein-tyrosine phosphatase
MAASVLRAKLAAAELGAQVVVTSAGTWGLHTGSPMDPRAEATLLRHGYPSEHVARHFRAADFAAYDLILATDRSNEEHLRNLATEHAVAGDIRLIRSFDPAWDGRLGVPDPFNGGPEDFEKVLAQLEAACDGLVADLVAGRPWQEP